MLYSTDKSEDLSKTSWIPLGIRLILKGGEVIVKEYSEKSDVSLTYLFNYI